MEAKIYKIHGTPLALKRPRFVNGKVWNSQKEVLLVYGIYLRGQHGDLPMYTGPLAIDVTFFFPLTGKKKDKPPYWHQFAPDTDNLLKFLLDCCNDTLFDDDSAVSCITAKKIYDKVARTEFTITELGSKS